MRGWFELSLRSWTRSLTRRTRTGSQGLIWGWHTGAGQKGVRGGTPIGASRGVSSHVDKELLLVRRQGGKPCRCEGRWLWRYWGWRYGLSSMAIMDGRADKLKAGEGRETARRLGHCNGGRHCVALGQLDFVGGGSQLWTTKLRYKAPRGVRGNYNLVEPRLNKVPRDWGNFFNLSRVRYIDHLDLTNFWENN